MSFKFSRLLASFAILGVVGGLSSSALAAKKRTSASMLFNGKDEAVAAALVKAAEYLKLGSIDEAKKALQTAGSQNKNELLKLTMNSLKASLSEAQGHWADAYFHATRAIDGYSALVKNSRADDKIRWNGAVRQLFFVAVKNSTLAGLSLESVRLFGKYKHFLSSDLLTTDEELILKRLADELRRVSGEKDAEAVESIIFRNYPFISQSLRETLVPDTVCRLDEQLESRQNKLEFASGLIQQLGKTEDTKNFAFALAGLTDAYKQITYPIDSLSGQQKSELLDLVEWLQSVREYEPALDITNKLILSQSFEPPFTRDRLISLHARNLNGNHRPVEAASFYRNLILQYPETDISNTARSKYVLSLHYAQKYLDVAREASSLAGIVRPRDVSWRTFWAHYLSKNYSLALSTSADDLKKLRRPRFNYWRARAYENDGRYNDAKKVFRQIPATLNSTLYTLFAQSRLKGGPLKPPQSQRSGVALAARGLHRFELSDTATLRRKKAHAEKVKGYGVLLSAGFAHLVHGPLKRAFEKTGNPDLALALVEAGDAYSVVRRAAYKTRIRGDVPLGKDGPWRGFLKKNSTVMEMLYPLPHANLIADAAETFGISPWLILGIMRAESLYQPKVVSSVGARGLMQIMPTTGERIAELTGYPNFEPAHLDKPEVSIAFGAWYLARLLNYYDHHLPLAIAGYNAGPEAIDRWISEKKSMRLDEFLEDIPYEQTRNYVAKVLGNMEVYSRVYSNGARGIRVDPLVSLPDPRKNMEMF